MSRLKGILLAVAACAAVSGAAAAQSRPPARPVVPPPPAADDPLAPPPDLGPAAPIANGRQHQPTRAEIEGRIGVQQGHAPAAGKPGARDEVDELYDQLLRQSAPRR